MRLACHPHFPFPTCLFAEASTQGRQDRAAVAIMQYKDSRQLSLKSDTADGEFTDHYRHPQRRAAGESVGSEVWLVGGVGQLRGSPCLHTACVLVVEDTQHRANK